MKYNKMTRRMFLQGSGGALLAIPFLESLLPSTAWGQTSAPPKRFITMFNNYDMGHHSNWLPGAQQTPYNIPQPAYSKTVNGETFRYQPLTEFAALNSSTSLAPLYGSSMNPYLNKMNIIRSLDYVDSRGHDSTRVLGGVSDAFPPLGSLPRIPTIDHVINAKIGDGLPVIFGGDSAGSVGWWSVAPTPAGCVNPPFYYGATALLSAIFNNGTYPESGAVSSSASRRDVLTRVLGDFNRVMNSRNISAADKSTLSNAMDVLSGVQRHLAAVVNSTQCTYKNIQGGYRISDAVANFSQGKAFADLLLAAIMCDAVRVLNIGTGLYQEQYLGENFDHQVTSHTPYAVCAANGKFEWQIMGERHSFTTKNVLAPLLQNLDSVVESNGKTILDNSLVFYSSECSLVHGQASHPVITFGSVGGAISTGNYIDYGDRTKPPIYGNDLGNLNPGDPQFTNNYRGIHYNRFLNTLLQAYGFAPSEYENGALQKELLNRTDIGPQNANLTTVGGYGYATAADYNSLSTNELTYNKSIVASFDLTRFKNKLPMP